MSRVLIATGTVHLPNQAHGFPLGSELRDLPDALAEQLLDAGVATLKPADPAAPAEPPPAAEPAA